MSLGWNDTKRQYEWEGDVRGLVNTVGNGDARLRFVLDKKSGAKISMNISGTDDEEATEPFYIESPDGENLYDAGNRKEAVKMLTNIRAGRDADEDSFPRTKRRYAIRAKSSKRRPSRSGGSIGTVR
jgi:hypothetical protein